jgi:hypothetical protein
MSPEAKDSTKRPDRSKPTRQPLGKRDRLSFRGKMDEGYNYRVINDEKSRLSDALEGGYEFVESEESLGDDKAAKPSAMGSKVSHPVGNNTTGYLMRIPIEFYNEDQAAKDADIKETEKGMQPKNQRDVEDAYGKGLESK